MHCCWRLAVWGLLVIATHAYHVGQEMGFSATGERPDEQLSPGVIEEVRQGAAKGNVDALHFLGLLYFYGVGPGIEMDASRAARLFRDAALKDHTAAMTNFAVLLASGVGVSRDDRAAAAWLQTAAYEGDADAAWMLGRFYLDGRVPLDMRDAEAIPELNPHATGMIPGPFPATPASAVLGPARNATDARHLLAANHWFSKAAERGSGEGAFHVALMAEYGILGTSDFPRARAWYSRASSLGHADATHHLALMLLYGRGGPQDILAAATQWKAIASDRQHGPASYYLGVLYMHGRGVPRDYEAARWWFTEAERLGPPEFATKAADVLRQLNTALDAVEARTKRVKERYRKLNAAASGGEVSGDPGAPTTPPGVQGLGSRRLADAINRAAHRPHAKKDEL